MSFRSGSGRNGSGYITKEVTDFHPVIDHIRRHSVYDHARHMWARAAKQLISDQIHQRKELETAGIAEFSREETDCFFTALFSIIRTSAEESEKTPAKYGGDEECALLVRLAEWRK